MPNRKTTSAAFIATLGSEPQVVTLALDLLLERDPALSEVAIVHTAQSTEPTATALRVLRDEWQRHSTYARLGYREVAIATDIGPVVDVDTAGGAGAAFRTLYRTVANAKRGGTRVHLSIAGGRKTMSVYGMAVAQLLFDDEDCLWHLISTGSLLTERRLHPRPEDEVHLVPIPVLLWNDTSPILTDLALRDDPFEAVKRQRELRAQSALRRQAVFSEHILSEAERDTVACLVRDGLKDRDIAARLCKSERTVAHQLSAAYDKARAYFGLEDVGRQTLIVLLGDYFKHK